MKILSRLVPTAAVLLLAAGVSPAFGQEATKPPVLKHEVEGREKCSMCHSGAIPDVPAAPESHKGRPVESCLLCHGSDAAMQSKTPKATPHDLAGRENCMMCHKSGVMAEIPDAPADHEGRKNEWCQMCHPSAK